MTTNYAAISGMHIGTADPTATDDFDAGYKKNALWFNATSGAIFFLYDDANSAADWRQIVTTTTAPNAIAAPKVTVTTVDPTVNDDVDLGYTPGSIWINTSDAGAFLCISNADGAADWDEFTTT